MPETDLTDDVLARLVDRTGTTVRRIEDVAGGPHVQLAGNWGEVGFRVVEARRLTRENIGAVVQSCLEGHGPPPLLISRWVPPELGRELTVNGIAFADAAGNLSVRAPGLFLDVEGKPAAVTPGPTETPTWTSVLKLIFVLLQRLDNIRRPYRELAERAGVSLGTVAWGMKYLEGLGHMWKEGRRRTLVDPEELYRTWEPRYPDTLRLVLGTKRLRSTRESKLAQVADAASKASPEDPILLGGELAAARIVGGLRPATLTLHSRRGWSAVAEQLDLAVDPEGPILHVGTIGTASAWKEHPTLVDPILLRAELLVHRSDRLHSLASRLLEEHIRPRWGETSGS